MRKLLILPLVALLLVGCGGARDNSEKNPSGHREYDINLADGRTLHCVQIGTGNSVSQTCDWPNAR